MCPFICRCVRVFPYMSIHSLRILAHCRGGIHSRIGISGGRASGIRISNRFCSQTSPFIRRRVHLFSDVSIYLHICPNISVGSWHNLAGESTRGSGFREVAPPGSAFSAATARTPAHLISGLSIYLQMCPHMSIHLCRIVAHVRRRIDSWIGVFEGRAFGISVSTRNCVPKMYFWLVHPSSLSVDPFCRSIHRFTNRSMCFTSCGSTTRWSGTNGSEVRVWIGGIWA